LDEVGGILREAREAKGLTLADAHEGTKISTQYLSALENGQFELLPTQVHAKGYLRNYARFLELDPDPLIIRYEISISGHPSERAVLTRESLGNDKAIPPVEDQPFFDPVNVDISSSGTRKLGSSQRWIIIIALLISLALVANRFIPLLTGNGDGSEALTNSIQEAVESITNDSTAEAEAVPTSENAALPEAGAVITSTSRNDPVSLPTLTPTRPSLPETMETVRLRLDVTERTWMQVTVDDEVVFEGLARRGDEAYEWEAQDYARLLAGNGIGLFVTLNDVELGKLGGRGEVVDETWTATSAG